jgi:hypothetical protein
MGNLTISEAIETLESLGCTIQLEGERLKVRGPEVPEVAALVSELRAQREEALRLVRERGSAPPTEDEVKRLLPLGVRVVRYAPKTPPVAVAPVSVVTNVGKFIRACLGDLESRLENPDQYSAPPLPEILSKLADVGLELKIEDAAGVPNAHGLVITDDDLPF